MRRASLEGGSPDSQRVKQLYKEATGRDLQDDWLATVKNTSDNKPSMTEAEIKRAGDLAKSVKESTLDVARRSEEMGNTARVLDSKLHDLRTNADGKAVDRLFRDILSGSSENKIASRMFAHQGPSEDLVKAARDWSLSNDGKLDGPFDKERARQLLIAHLEPELNRVNAAHKDLIDSYASNQIEKEAYALSHQVNEPSTVAGRDLSEPSAIKPRVENSSEPIERARIAPMNESINDATEQFRQNAIKAMENNRDAVLRANDQHVKEVMAKRLRDGVPGKPGEAHQGDIYKMMVNRLQKLQSEGKVSKDWSVEPGLIGGAADNAKADFIMVNKRTGEVHVLDATSNEVKANNEDGKLSPLRERGIIKFDPKAFDYRAKSDDVRVDTAMTDLENTIDKVFKELNTTPSGLIIGETPFPSTHSKGSVDNQIEDLKKLKAWLETQNNSELKAYAREVQGGITYLENQAKTKVASTVMNENLSEIADRLNLRLALKKIRDVNTPPAMRNQVQQPQKAPETKTDVHIRNKNEASIKDNGTNYQIDPEKVMKDSVNRLTRKEQLLSKDELDKLRKLPALKNKSDADITKMVRDQLYENGRMAGNRIGENKHLILVDDLVQTLRTTDTARITQAKPETATGAVDNTTVGKRVDKTDPIAKIATDSGVKPAEMDKLVADAKSVWTAFELPPKLEDVQAKDAKDFFDIVIEEKSSSWTPAQKLLMEKLRTAYENGDQSATHFLARILR